MVGLRLFVPDINADTRTVRNPLSKTWFHNDCTLPVEGSCISLVNDAATWTCFLQLPSEPRFLDSSRRYQSCAKHLKECSTISICTFKKHIFFALLKQLCLSEILRGGLEINISVIHDVYWRSSKKRKKVNRSKKSTHTEIPVCKTYVMILSVSCTIPSSIYYCVQKQMTVSLVIKVLLFPQYQAIY